MKQNRVISGAVAALVLAALLAGCGSTATGASSADSTPAATEAAGSEATAPTAEPQTEAALPDGVYTAEFETDSSMVHANEACDGKGTPDCRRWQNDLPCQPGIEKDRQPVPGHCRGRPPATRATGCSPPPIL